MKKSRAMVELKSFKVLDIDEAGAKLATAAAAATDGTEMANAAGSSQPAQEELSSLTSVSSIHGGNLTATSSESSLKQQQPENKQTDEQSSNKTTTTLSSNEEYQTAHHDMHDISETTSDSELHQATNDQENTVDVTKINIEASSTPAESQPKTTTTMVMRPRLNSDSEPVRKTQAIFKQSFSSPQIVPKNATEIAKTPLSLRHQIHIKQHQQQHQQNSLPGSPLVFHSNNKFKAADSVSQYSFGGQRNEPKSNHFEIRWHNINLYAKKSKVPRIIEENSIYKFFTKNKLDDDGAAFGPNGGLSFPENIYYSPPIRHKINLPPTIREDSELGGGLSKSSSSSQDGASMHAAENGMKSSSTSPPSGGQQYRQVLNNLSGSVFSGQLTAVLGPSGVGKTMLLNSLTGRNTLDGTGKVSLIGGASKRMSVVTVPQADVLPGKLTTLEDLRFTSRLKNPRSDFDHKRNIDRVVKLLQLEKFLNTKIDKLSGGEARRLSIGRELLSSPDIMILDEPTSGLDANTCKRIITALRDIVEHSDNILDRPMSIIVTIHQPQQEVLNLFHRAYIVAIGGKAIYEGPPAALLPTIIEQSSLSRLCPVDQLNENPAIVALEVASGEYGQEVIGELATYHELKVQEEFNYPPFVDEFGQLNSPLSTPRNALRAPRKSPLSVSPRFDFAHHRGRSAMDSPIGRRTPTLSGAKQFRAATSQLDRVSNVTSVSYASTYDAELPEPVSKLKVDKRLRRSVVMKTDFISQTLTLMSRCWLLTTRDIFLMSIRILGFLMVAGGTVQIFSHALDPNEHQCPVFESEVDDVLSFISSTKDRLFSLPHNLKQSSSTHLFFFHLVLCLTMVTSALTGLVFPLQMRMFVREYKNGWYTPASFVMSQTLAELPVDIIGPTLSLLITYPLCNQPTSEYYWREIAYIVVLTLASIICKSQAQIVGAILMDSVENSVFISCVVVTPPALLSGIAVRVSQMSLPLQWLSYGSFLRYAFESLFVVRYGYGICPCDLELVDGYPVRTSANAIPPQLDNLARGLLDLNQATPNVSTTTVASNLITSDESIDANIFLKFLRLVTDAGNLFVPHMSDLGDCNRYRSLYLMDMDIEDRILPKWLGAMLIMFILSRIITYFVVKTVIKMRRN